MSGHYPGKRAKIRIVIFAIFIIGAVALFRFSPVRDLLTAEQISHIGIVEPARLFPPASGLDVHDILADPLEISAVVAGLGLWIVALQLT